MKMPTTIPMADAIGAMTLEVEMKMTGIRLAKVRMWLGAAIFRIGARVIGCGIEIKEPK